jgi:RNA polymerase sigma-70 factor (ECF subfamily)
MERFACKMDLYKWDRYRRVFHLNEAELIRRSQAGEREAFQALLEQYRVVLMRTAYLTTRDRDTAQDVMQDTLIQIWRSMPKYRPHGSFKAWLLKILMNQARRQYRKKRVETVPLEKAMGVEERGDGPVESVMREEDAQHVRKALDILSTDHREVLILRYYSELTVPEISKALGCREGTVKSRLNRALSNLEGAITKNYPVKVPHGT